MLDPVLSPIVAVVLLVFFLGFVWFRHVSDLKRGAGAASVERRSPREPGSSPSPPSEADRR